MTELKYTCSWCSAAMADNQTRYCSAACKYAASKPHDSPQPPRVCAQCNKTYSPVHKIKKQAYCSDDCKRLAKNARKRISRAGRHQELNARRTPNKECARCGAKYYKRPSVADSSVVCGDCFRVRAEPKQRARQALQVILKAYKANIERTCITCGDSFTSPTAHAKKCDKCRSATFVMLKTCIECGQGFTTLDRKWTSTCSIECQSARHKRQRYVHGKPRRRARHFGVKYEPVDKEIVFEKAGWRCQLCGCSTPKSRMGKCYHNSPELDHIVPMSKGGDHLYVNVQLACRQCNSEKSNKHSMGQAVMDF